MLGSAGLLLARDGLARALARARVGLGALAVDGKSTTVTQPLVATDLHLAADVAGHLPAQVTLDAEVLVDVAERSMSAPIYDLLKRPDELFVVEHAHLQPRFVEDSVRHALRDALDTLPQLDNGDFLLSKQVNFETIHVHDVVAERYGTVGELRGELATGDPSASQTTLAAWLAAS